MYSRPAQHASRIFLITFLFPILALPFTTDSSQLPVIANTNNEQPGSRSDLRVPGRNVANYTDGGPENQLFETIELAVSPKIPVADEPILMYLLGVAPDVECLESARLSITMYGDSDELTYLELLLNETMWLRVRERMTPSWTPNNVLKPGWNELLADFRFIGIFIDTGDYSFEIRARLSCGRILFGFGQTFHLEQTP